MNAPAPQHVQPQPVPTTWVCEGLATDTGQRILAVQIASPTGTAIYFLQPDEAKTIAAQIEQAADQLRTGLILPPGVNGIQRP